MFGIGTGEMLVIGLVAIAWLAFKGRAGAAMVVLAGLGLLVALVVAGIFAGIFFSRSGPRVTPAAVESMQIAPDGTQYWVSDQASQSGAEHSQWTPDGKQYWPGGRAMGPPTNVGNTTWSIALRPMIFMAIAFLALLALAAHRGLGHAFAGGHGHIWPVFLVVPIIVFLMLGGIRYQTFSHFNAAEQDAPPPVVVEQQKQWAAEQVKQAKAYQKQLAEQSRQLTALLEKIVKSTALFQHIDQADIHELMDEYDAPRILLQTPMVPSAAPTALLLAAASAAKESAAKESATASADGDTTTKPDKKIDAKAKTIALKSSAGDAKRPAAVELKMESTADGKPGNISIAVEAEAPQPPAAPVPPVPPVVAAVPAEELKPAAKVEPARLVKSGNTPPAWINDPPKRMGDVRREVIATDPFATDDECYHAGDVALMLKAYDRLQQLTGQLSLALDATQPTRATHDSDRAARMMAMGITPEFLRRELVAKDPGSNESREYLETVTSSVGPMKKLYMQIEFTPAMDRELLQFAEAYSRQERFSAVGFGAGSVLTLLTMVWGLLKIDTATKGYYTKRLFLGVPAAIIAGVIAVITWMNYHL